MAFPFRPRFKLYRRFREDPWGWFLRRRTARTAYHLALHFLSLRRSLPPLRDLVRTALSSHPQPPPPLRRRRSSPHRRRLMAKQKVQLFYALSRNYRLVSLLRRASRERGSLERNLVGLLESRLCTVLARSLFFATAAEARTHVLAYGVLVNGVATFRPQRLLVRGDSVALTTFAAGPAYLRYGGAPPVRRRPRRSSLLRHLRSVPERRRRLPWAAFPSSHLEVDYGTGFILFFRRPAVGEISYPFRWVPSDLIAHYR